MKVRSRYLEDNRVVADAETLQWDLRQSNPITAIEIKFHATTGAGVPVGPPLLNEITNLRVVDGSKNYWSAGLAKYLHGMGYGLGHKLPVSIVEVTASEESEQTIMLYFGRYFGDRSVFFDPKMANNPQLQFTSNLTIAANNYATGTLRCSIIIHSLEGADLSHSGVMICKEVIAQTVGAAAVVRTDMPVDQPWWSLGIFNESAAAVPLHPFPTIERIELDINNGERVPFQYQAVDMIQDNIRDLGLVQVCESQMVDWAINLAMGLQIPNITLETNMCAPYGGTFVPFHHIYRQAPLEFSPSDQARLITTGGTVGGVARIVLAQIADTSYFG